MKGLVARIRRCRYRSPRSRSGCRPIPAADLVKALEGTNYVRPMLVLAAWCGLRAKEIAGLRAENVLVSDDPPHILIVSEATKGRRERNVPLSPFVVAEMQAAKLPARGPVFTDKDNHPLTPWSVSKMCNDHLRSLGITSTLHTLRHFFATSAYAIGSDIGRCRNYSATRPCRRRLSTEGEFGADGCDRERDASW